MSSIQPTRVEFIQFTQPAERVLKSGIVVIIQPIYQSTVERLLFILNALLVPVKLKQWHNHQQKITFLYKMYKNKIVEDNKMLSMK